MSGHNICFHGEIRKIIFELFSIPLLNIWSSDAVMCPENADGMAKSVDLDQNAPKGASVLVCIVCSDVSIPIF